MEQSTKNPLEFFGFMERETNPILFGRDFWTTPNPAFSDWRLTFLGSEISINRPWNATGIPGGGVDPSKNYSHELWITLFC